MWVPFGIESLTAAPSDSGIFAWRAGITVCGNMGDGWRLPSMADLATLYDRGFRASNNWYVTQNIDLYPASGSDYRIRILNMATGAMSYGVETSAYHLRCVRGF